MGCKVSKVEPTIVRSTRKALEEELVNSHSSSKNSSQKVRTDSSFPTKEIIEYLKRQQKLNLAFQEAISNLEQSHQVNNPLISLNYRQQQIITEEADLLIDELKLPNSRIKGLGKGIYISSKTDSIESSRGPLPIIERRRSTQRLPYKLQPKYDTKLMKKREGSLIIKLLPKRGMAVVKGPRTQLINHSFHGGKDLIQNQSIGDGGLYTSRCNSRVDDSPFNASAISSIKHPLKIEKKGKFGDMCRLARERILMRVYDN